MAYISKRQVTEITRDKSQDGVDDRLRKAEP